MEVSGDRLSAVSRSFTDPEAYQAGWADREGVTAWMIQHTGEGSL